MRGLREGSDSGFAVPRDMLVAASLGIGLFWTWTLLTCYDLMIFPPAESATAYAHNVWIWNSWAQALTFIMIAVFSRTVKTLLNRRASIAVAAFIASISTALFPMGSVFLTTNGFAAFCIGMVGAVATGCIGACTILMWAELLSIWGARTSIVVMNASLIISALLYALVSVLPQGLAIIVVVLLPCLAGVLLVLCKRLSNARLTTRPVQKSCQNSPRILIPLTALFFCALCGEVFRNLITVTQDDSSFVLMGAIYAIAGGVGVLVLSIVLIASRAHRKVSGDSLAIRIVLAAMVLGYLLTVVINASIYIGYAFFCAVFGGIRSLSWMFTARIVERGGASPLTAYAISLSSFSLPVALSTAFMSALTAGISDGSVPWTSVASAIITALFFIAIMILDPRDIRSNWGVTPTNPDDTASLKVQPVFATEEMSGLQECIDAKTEKVAARGLDFLQERFGLTNREMDVAELLYQGRSIPFIQEALCIAEGTALTHARHIYRKMDVHSRQEFITKVRSIQQNLIARES